MDLGSVVQQMRLDAFAVQASSCLGDAGVPHVLLKGPTTASWLYSAGRRYVDVDMLVPPAALRTAVEALERDGVAFAIAGRLGEEASHSLLLRGSNGAELDLHVTLPLMRRADGDRLWDVLTRHIVDFELDSEAVPALSEPARGVVVALHALGAAGIGQPAEDLSRLLDLGPNVWSEVESVAGELDVLPLVQASAALSRGEVPSSDLPVDVRLLLTPSAGSAFQLQRLAQASWRDLPRLVAREAVPTRGFMRSYAGNAALSGPRLYLTYVLRWGRLARALPTAVRLVRQAHRT